MTVQLRAPRPAVYAAVSDPRAIARWRFPGGMTSSVDVLGDGDFRVTLTYEAADQQGRTTSHSDVHRARFTRLVPDELVVEVDEFESADPASTGEMTVTLALRDAPGGTELTADNELGRRMALDRLAALVEG